MPKHLCETNSAVPVLSLAEGDVAWETHPSFSNVRIGRLGMARPDDCVRFALVEMASSSIVAEHIHENEDDVLYVLRGSAVLWTELTGDIPLTAGSFVRVPKGVRHRPHSFSNDFRIFNAWTKSPNAPSSRTGASYDQEKSQ
jgi:mannose-6-phosphate isomerase-like protein (cupin superfamily)